VLTAESNGHDVVERRRLRSQGPPRQCAQVPLLTQELENPWG
jgi:hypothetical protein